MKYDKEKYVSFMKEFNPEIIIGKGTDGEFIKIKLHKVVHLLFGGESGSGKSVFVLQLLFQMLFLTNPDSLKLILVDPLRVSFKDFKELPNLVFPVSNTAGEAIQATNKMMQINRERYVFLENVGIENIYEYNEALLHNKIPFKDEKGLIKLVGLEQIPDEYIQKTKTENYIIGEPVPQLIVFYDEFNALMLDVEFGGKNPSEASSPALKNLIGISEQARKAGILIILGTQKISADTVPTAIRGNLKTRISLKVSSGIASRTILGDTPENNTQGAKLIGYGDLLVFNQDLNSSFALRGQSFFVSNEDMLDLINGIVLTYGKNSFDYIKVNEEYAQNSEDLEPLPIDYDLYKIGLPELIIVKNNVFLKSQYTKLLSEIIRKPFEWDEKILSLRYPSLKKELKIVKQQLMDAGILSFLKIEGEKEGYIGLNYKLRGMKYVLNKHGIEPEVKETWNTDEEDYQVDMMKLLLITLNKAYNSSAKNLSTDISEYGS